MARKSRTRTIGRAARVTRKPKARPYRKEASLFFDLVEDISSPDVKAEEQIEEFHKAEKRRKSE